MTETYDEYLDRKQEEAATQGMIFCTMCEQIKPLARIIDIQGPPSDPTWDTYLLCEVCAPTADWHNTRPSNTH